MCMLRVLGGRATRRRAEVFAKELRMAEILASYGHKVYLLPESNDGRKNPDALVDGVLTEFKWVTGDVRIVGKRFSDARKQCNDVFLCVDSSIPMLVVYRKLKGEVLFHKYTHGTVYVYVGSMLYEWHIGAFGKNNPPLEQGG